MNRDAKRISPHSTAQISRIKGHILNSSDRGFDGDVYPFKPAIAQLKKSGETIKYD
jgi:hypothetical protein